MQLFGSTTSPYVRRLRMWLAAIDMPFEFINLDIFSAEGRAILKANNPTLKVPMLKDGDLTLFDSRQIHRYLSEKSQQTKLSWEAENSLTLIDAANDSFVELLLMSRSGIAMDSDLLFVKLQRERVAEVLQVLNDKAENGAFEPWGYPAVCLFCLLDWVNFRELCDLNDFAALSSFWQTHKTRSEALASDPRG